MNKINIEISWGELWKFFIFVLLATVMVLGERILAALFLALVISSGLESAVDFLERRKVPRILGVVLVFLIFILAIVAIFYTLIPILVINLNSFLTNLSQSLNSLWRELKVPPSYYSASSYSVKPFNNLINNLLTQLFSGNISPLVLFSQIFGGLTLVFSVLAISFYLSLSKDGVENFLRALFPTSHEEAALKIYARSRRKISSWFNLQIILSLTIGFLTWLALTILGVHYAVLLGAATAIFELVPFVGPILGGALSVLVALTTSLSLAFYTLIAFLAIQQFEAHILVPLLTRRAVGVHPAIAIVALLMGIEVGGVLGAIIAIPVTVVLLEVLEERDSQKKASSAQ